MRKWIWTAVAGVLLLLFGLIYWQLDLPNWQKLDLARIQARPESTVVYDALGNEAGTLGAVQLRSSVRLSEVPQDVIDAFLTA